MNVSESEKDEASVEGFVEHDKSETQLGYGPGHVPLYIGAIWILFILSYLAIMFFLALPDFRSWTAQ